MTLNSSSTKDMLSITTSDVHEKAADTIEK